jgi:hypothetical protein
MGMVSGDFGTAKLTRFYVFLTPDELAEGSECVLKSRLYCIHYWLTIYSRLDLLARASVR